MNATETAQKIYIWSSHCEDHIDTLVYATPELRDAAITVLVDDLLEETGRPLKLDYDKTISRWVEVPYSDEEWEAMEPIVRLRAMDEDVTHDIDDVTVITSI